MKPKSLVSNVGIGATDEFSLRVSVAALVRVLFAHPTNGELMLALERKATLLEADGLRSVDVKAQPFGGAIRIHNTRVLQDFIGDFHFDSEESSAEQDFRIFIRPVDWGIVRAFCLGHFSQGDDSVLESDPGRELREEFADALKMDLRRDQYAHQAAGTIIEDQPSPANNFHARGFLTARIYRVFEARILDRSLVSAMVENSESYSNGDLRELALQDSQSSGSGRANAVLLLPLRELSDFYFKITFEARNQSIMFHDHQLDETVAAILNDVSIPKYRRI